MPKRKANKRHTPEFKIMVVETMRREKLSYRETAREFEIADHDRVRYWERIHFEEGPEGLRLSKDDERAGESLSIENQNLILTKYVREQGWNLC